MLEIVIPDWRPSAQLSLNGRRRCHWTTIRAEQDAAKWVLRAKLGPIRAELPVIDGKARVTVTFFYPTRRRVDEDGCAGMAKPLLDELVTWGVLADDDSEHVALTVRVVTGARKTETRIQIEEYSCSRS
jgi:hypothetical protein